MTPISSDGWRPKQFENGWRATQDPVLDGRLWDTEELCQAYIDGIQQGWLDCSRSKATGLEHGGSPQNDDSGRFWRLQGIYVERLPADDGLRIWVQGGQVVLGAESAESLLQWLDRSRS